MQTYSSDWLELRANIGELPDPAIDVMTRFERRPKQIGSASKIFQR